MYIQIAKSERQFDAHLPMPLSIAIVTSRRHAATRHAAMTRQPLSMVNHRCCVDRPANFCCSRFQLELLFSCPVALGRLGHATLSHSFSTDLCVCLQCRQELSWFRNTLVIPGHRRVIHHHHPLVVPLELVGRVFKTEDSVFQFASAGQGQRLGLGPTDLLVGCP